MSEKKSPADRITDRIIADLEAGVATWKQPWDSLGAVALPVRLNGEPYQGINTLMLWATAGERGYRAHRWMTYRQAAALGGQVRKGEASTLVVYYGQSQDKREDASAGAEGEGRSFRFLKGYPVFNVEQIDGLDPEFYPAEVVIAPERIHDKNPDIEVFLDATGASISWAGDQAYYAPGPDHIRLPEMPLYRDVEQAYATAMHELVHWSGAKHRLDREFGKRFGDDRYAMEELVAELGAAFLGAHFGLRPDHITNHSEYIGHWLRVLKSDNRAIFTAAGQAQKAVDFILSKAGRTQSVQGDEIQEAA